MKKLSEYFYFNFGQQKDPSEDFNNILVEIIDDVDEIFFLPTNRSFTNTCNNISLSNDAWISICMDVLNSKFNPFEF